MPGLRMPGAGMPACPTAVPGFLSIPVGGCPCPTLPWLGGPQWGWQEGRCPTRTPAGAVTEGRSRGAGDPQACWQEGGRLLLRAGEAGWAGLEQAGTDGW